MVMRLSAMHLRSLDWEDPLEKEMAAHTSILYTYICVLGAPRVGQLVKNSPAMQETWEAWVQSLGWEDPLEKGMATHSSILAWRIPWTEEPGRLQSMWSLRVRRD